MRCWSDHLYSTFLHVTEVSPSSIGCQTECDAARRRMRHALHAGDDVPEGQRAALAAGRLPCSCRAAAQRAEDIAQPRPATGLLLWGAGNLRSQSNAVTTGKLYLGCREESTEPEGLPCANTHHYPHTVDIWGRP